MRLDKSPESFRIHVSADNRYKLYVNGKFVVEVPASSDDMHWNYEPGVDITQDYIDTANPKAEKEGLKIEFIQENMRDFSNPESFDIILNLCTSFGYMETKEQDLEVLKNVFNNLKVNGVAFPGNRTLIQKMLF